MNQNQTNYGSLCQSYDIPTPVERSPPLFPLSPKSRSGPIILEPGIIPLLAIPLATCNKNVLLKLRESLSCTCKVISNRDKFHVSYFMFIAYPKYRYASSDYIVQYKYVNAIHPSSSIMHYPSLALARKTRQVLKNA